MRYSTPIGLFTPFLFLVTSVVSADIQSQTVVLDIEKETISPGAPTINIATNPSVVLDILPTTCTYKIVPSFGESRIATKGLSPNLRNVVKGRSARLPAFLTRLELMDATKSASTELQAEAREQEGEKPVTLASSVVLNFSVGAAESATQDPQLDHLWRISLKSRHQDYAISVTPQGTADPCKSGKTYYVVIHVDRAPFELNWSAGFAVSSLRDDRLRLDPVDKSEPARLTIVSTGQQGLPSNLIAAAHYCYARPSWNWLCLSTGLGTDLPSTGVLLLAGVSVRLKPVQSANAFYLTGSAIYGQHKVLGDDYVGKQNPQVPSGTTPSSLLTSRYKVGFALGLSYGFLGSEDKFKGVYSKTGSPTDPAPKATETKTEAKDKTNEDSEKQ